MRGEAVPPEFAEDRRISGHVYDLEKRIARRRANLANLDATIKLFSHPAQIPMTFRQSGSIAGQGILLESSRLTQDALRTALGPLTSSEIAAAVMQAKGMPSGDVAFKGIVAN